jgi:hypothetical protein
MRIKKGILFLPLMFCLVVPSGAVKLSFKLTGGLMKFQPEAINRAATDWYEMQILEDENRNLWTVLEGEARTISGLFQFEGELLLHLHKRFALSIGSGFDYAGIDTDGAHVVMSKPTGDFDLVHTQKVTAVPLVLSGYCFLPLGSRVQLYARAGGGRLFARYIDREGSKKVDATKYGFSLDQSTGASAPMYVGALGITFATPSGLSFLVEVGWRQARITDLTGETEEWDDWNIYSFEQYYSDLDFWRLRHSLYSELPSGEDVRNAQSMAIDMGGWSVRVGIIIHF